MHELALETALGVVPLFLEKCWLLPHVDAATLRAFLLDSPAHELGVSFDELFGLVQADVSGNVDARERRRDLHIVVPWDFLALQLLESSLHVLRSAEMCKTSLRAEVADVDRLRIWAVLLHESLDGNLLRVTGRVAWPTNESYPLQSWVKLVTPETGSTAESY